LKLGQMYVAKGSIEQAIAAYQSALKSNPNDANLYYFLGQLYEARQEWTLAKRMYQKSLAIKPQNVLASNNLAYVLLQTNTDVDAALALAQDAKRGMPESPNVADTLGWAFYKKGAYQSAIEQFKDALRLNAKNQIPESPTYHYHLGLAYEKTEQAELAKQQFKRVLEINPDYTEADQVKKLLAQL
jgi:tetratricopeptide (TPR) repeat protein